jgi:hypothetical protein
MKGIALYEVRCLFYLGLKFPLISQKKIMRLLRLGLVSGLIYFICLNPSMGEQNREGINRLSFGRVMPDQQVEKVITFQNTSGRDLEIVNISSTPPLVTKDVTRLVFRGGVGRFRLVLGDNRESGLFEGTVQVDFKAGTHPPFRLEVDAFVVPDIEFKPFPAFFVGTYFNKRTVASIEIINHREEPLILTGVETTSDRFDTELETLTKGQHYRLSLILDGGAEPGKKQEEIILLADPPTDRPLRVQANTYIRTRVYNFPDSVDMGALPLKVATHEDSVQTLAQTLMVYRPDTDDFEVKAEVDLDYIALDTERGPNGDRYQLTLTVIPEKVTPGKIEGAVRIVTNDEEFSVIEVPVTGFILE